ncbi:MAG: hypothetical protein NUV56_03075 [Candidatus Uhrbacteria bacterium]|nr:hypothetical protein [Candidatus Uhrbacteria bacterium]
MICLNVWTEPHHDNGDCAYFLYRGALFEAVWRVDEYAPVPGWQICDTFKLTDCDSDYAVDLMKIGALLTCKGWADEGWTMEDIRLIKQMANLGYYPPRTEEVREEVARAFHQALNYYEHYIMTLPYERRMIENRRYYRRHLQPRKKETIGW